VEGEFCELRDYGVLGSSQVMHSPKFAPDCGWWHHASSGKVDPPLEKRVGKGEAMSINPQDGSQPTVVLVHGAFADASSWNEVIKRLQAEGLQVTAPANPLRGISIDSAYIGSFLEQIPGPVLAVAHSYGGAVITNAATNATNVVGLVYVAAFAPDEGETLGAIASNSRDSVVLPALVELQYPTGEGEETAVEFTIDPDKFHEVFAFDLSGEQSALMAATQRPLSGLPFSEPTGVPAWKKLPSWAVVSSGDKVVGTDAVRSMAERAGATITEVEGSHVIMISQPQVVAETIMTALAAVSQDMHPTS
jgi:pimeloyl-ACP methyl ester carboxylesterase